MLRRPALLFTTAVILVAAAATFGSSRAARTDEKPIVDVSDISFLWPVPNTQADVDALISADTADATTNEALWNEAAFKRMLEIVTSDDAEIKHPNGASRRISLLPEFRDRKNWKVVGFRADPSAPGGHPSIVEQFGSTPQLRLIVQPVTVDGANVKVHDFTAHLVYSFATPKDAPKPGFIPAENPDEKKFRAILDDLVALKAKLKAKGIDTQGAALGVHPGLKDGAGGADFASDVRALLTRHVNVKNLSAMAFMGLPNAAPEPWMFVAAVGAPDGTFAPGKIPAIGFKSAQMFDQRDGDPVVVPTPLPTNRNPITNFVGTSADDRRGVATFVLFDTGVKLNETARVNSSGAPVLDADGLTNADIPDLIANPEKTHFFSNDCFSCHSESTRRALNSLPPSATFGYKRPSGVAGVDPNVLPTQIWNVRNFGWFPDFFNAGATSPTVTQRTANETADCVQFINRVYFGNP